eukprot:10805336-Prorocentrum_lima.AAC.1
MASTIKWHTAENRWWRSPGYKKRADLREQVNLSSSIVPIYLAPEAPNVVYFANELGVDQN